MPALATFLGTLPVPLVSNVPSAGSKVQRKTFGVIARDCDELLTLARHADASKAGEDLFGPEEGVLKCRMANIHPACKPVSGGNVRR